MLGPHWLSDSQIRAQERGTLQIEMWHRYFYTRTDGSEATWGHSSAITFRALFVGNKQRDRISVTALCTQRACVEYFLSLLRDIAQTFKVRDLLRDPDLISSTASTNTTRQLADGTQSEVSKATERLTKALEEAMGRGRDTQADISIRPPIVQSAVADVPHSAALISELEAIEAPADLSDVDIETVSQKALPHLLPGIKKADLKYMIVTQMFFHRPTDRPFHTADDYASLCNLSVQAFRNARKRYKDKGWLEAEVKPGGKTPIEKQGRVFWRKVIRI